MIYSWTTRNPVYVWCVLRNKYCSNLLQLSDCNPKNGKRVISYHWLRYVQKLGTIKLFKSSRQIIFTVESANTLWDAWDGTMYVRCHGRKPVPLSGGFASPPLRMTWATRPLSPTKKGGRIPSSGSGKVTSDQWFLRLLKVKSCRVCHQDHLKRPN